MRILLWLITLAWPFLVWLAITHPQLHWLIPLLALLFLLRLPGLRRSGGAFARAGQLLALAGVALCLASYLLRSHQLLLWYPVAVSVVMLLLFGGSLCSAMPMVERLARIREPQLPPPAIRWTRRVTQIWCLFFIFNGSVATATCLAGNLHWWTLWNGIISYLLMGLLMAGEWLLRQRIRRQA
ncbi:hypothetical protein N5923_22410 [Erwiniaceae bacterium BAC15a-03b]|uniref:DNA gyrase subunit B n=1 Tax=Winslowiella arboricola TaxID=2978220 RepID=A0A9J6PUT0_9GAMM|nr:hypothetical protein [Winslowiella arboricola]MCU5775352.1 hypothetical protein [Winslowiella arboricola]MCU5780251.1 hypothetical protein [Winslowiella arboricola]